MARAGKTITEAALRWPDLLESGDLVVLGQASAEPASLAKSLVAQRHLLSHVRAFVGIGFSDCARPEQGGGIAFQSYCGTGSNRRLGHALSILPVPYDQLAQALSVARPVVLLSLAPGADAAHLSYGAGADYPSELIANARLVIAEVNSQAPRTGSGRDLRRDQLDLIVETDTALPSPVPVKATAVDQAIARHVAAMIPNGATLQIGLGAIPAAILEMLADHNDLGIHSGLIGDGVAALAEAGVITNAFKSVDRGVSVCGVLAGGERLMRWADANRSLAVRPTGFTHDPAILRSIDSFVALNSAIEVDLTGQVNAEVAGGRYVGAVGGAGVFLRGAHAARGGLPIIALPATAGSRSRIVAALSGPVSTARSDVGFVVTEYGAVDLRGADLARRRALMLSICDPAHRAALEDAGP